MIYNPTSITKCLSSQGIYYAIKYGQMFYYSDTNTVWYDTQNKTREVATDITILQFERQRNNFVPEPSINLIGNQSIFNTPYASPEQNYSIVYVIETNCLYQYKQGVWTTLYGKYGQKIVAQTYLPNGVVKTIVADDVTTNGILNDGSVVVRDNNKMICGIFSSDGYILNLKSLIGGCINIDPSGTPYGDGCLQLNSNPGKNEQPKANLNADLIVFGNLRTVASDNWLKQYRLITEEISINANTQIMQGSTVKANSQLGNIKYNIDTVLTETVNCTEGKLTIGSKIYINSVINNQVLQPPFLFDIENVQSNYTSMSTTVSEKDISIENNVLSLNIDFNFINDGDCIYIKVSSSLTNITKIKSKIGTQINVDFIAKEGINNTAKIVYYAINNTVKILP